MNDFNKFSENTLLVWTCLWVLVAVALRLLTWRETMWLPGSWTGHYQVWLLMLRFMAGLAALGGGILLRLRRR